MNKVSIIIQSKDDPKNLVSTPEKAEAMREGLTVVFMESATKGGQLGIELIIKGADINGNRVINGYTVTENNFEAIMGAFIGARMRFGRMPEDQWEMVRHYVKQQVARYLETLAKDSRDLIEKSMKKFFNISN